MILERQYGLIVPKKAQKLYPDLQKLSMLGNDSDDDNEHIAGSECLGLQPWSWNEDGADLQPSTMDM